MVGFPVWDWVRAAAWGTAVSVLGGLAGTGCAGQSTNGSEQADLCPDVCNRGKKCPLPAGTPPIQNCDDECLGEDALALQAGCHDAYLKSVACLSKLSDVCTGPTACLAEIKVVYDCEHSYCMAHGGDPTCVNLKN
jgi:hypothetical protein